MKSRGSTGIKKKIWLSLVVMLTLFCIMSIGNCSEVKLTGSQQPVDAKYFGLHMHRIVNPVNPANKTPWPDVKFGTWRLWDAYVDWPNLEPKKGEWNFSTLDKYVEIAGQHNVEILLPLGLTPQWASARPDEKCSYEPGNAAEPRDLEDWRNYVRTIAKRYKGKIHHYELWNEVSFPSFYSGNQKELVNLAREAYKILKEIDPAIVFVSPSVAGNKKESLAWLDKYFKEGGSNYADVVGYHFYVATEEPEAVIDLVRKVQALMSKNGLAGKQLWNTESGWWIANTDGYPETGAVKNWKRLLPIDAANYVARALIIANVAGIKRFYWYAWDNGFMGFMEQRSKVIKPSGRAYGQVYEWLEGSVLKDCTQAGQLWTCNLLDAKGSLSRLVWTTGKDTVWTPPRSWKAVSYQTLDGQRHSLKEGTSINLTQAPMRIVSRISP